MKYNAYNKTTVGLLLYCCLLLNSFIRCAIFNSALTRLLCVHSEHS